MKYLLQCVPTIQYAHSLTLCLSLSLSLSLPLAQVYNETIRDLLVPSAPLNLREDGQKGLVVAGLSRHTPKTANDILSMLEIGNQNRTQHPTDANATSSRSHAVFQVSIHNIYVSIQYFIFDVLQLISMTL